MAASLQEVQAAVEAAVLQFQNPATQPQAEAVLLQFRRSPGVLPAARHVLEHSGSVDARFHAACALREGVLREWPSLPPGERAALRSYALQQLLLNAAEPQLGVVRSALQAAVAVMLKRGWMDADETARAAFFQELDASSKAVGSPPAQIAALQVLEAVVSEFSLTTASALGLPWEFHESCRNSLESKYLQQIFRHALGCAQQAAAEAAAGAPGSDAAAAMATAAMQLMTAVLAWDFRAGTRSSYCFMTATLAGLTAAMAGRRGLPDTSQVKPGASWGELLLAPATTEWLLQLMPRLAGPAAATPLAQAARQLVVAFCSLVGDVFPQPPATPPPDATATVPAAPVRVAHVVRMLHLVLPWCVPARAALQQALAGDEAQLVDACRALAALCGSHKPGVLEAASAQLGAANGSQAGSVFTALEELSVALLAAGGVSAASAPEPWVPDCTELLLECWAGLLQPQAGYNMCSVAPPAAAVDGAGRTSVVLLEAALADAAAGALEDADDDADAGAGAVHQEEWMSRVALLLRANVAASFNQLADLLAAKQQGLAAAAAAHADPSALLEQLYWLARMAAHALADSGVGEVPLPPEAILIAVGDSTPHQDLSCTTTGAATHRLQQEPRSARLLAAAAAAGAAAVERLSRSLLELTALCLNPAAAGVCSPRLLEGCVWGAARWADTYLFPEEEEPLPPRLAAAFGGASGAAVLDMLVLVSQHCLATHVGEAELHRQVCHSLLPTLVHRRPLSQRLLELQSWQALAAAFAQRQAALSVQLSQKYQRALSRSLCLAAAGFGQNTAAAQQYVSQLLLHTANELVSLAGQQQQQLAAAAQRADVQLQVCCMLEVLRGAAASTLPGTSAAMISMFSSLQAPLLVLHGAFKRVTPVVALLLKLADGVVEHLAVFMEAPQHKQQLLEWTLQLLVQYTDSNLWQVSLQTAKSLKAERASEQCRDLKAVLNLLIHTTQADLATGSDDDEPQQPPQQQQQQAGGAPAPEGPCSGTSAIARVVLVGLTIVLPLISDELLKFPKLAQLYYSLLSYMLEAYPRAVAELPAQHFGSLMASLEWGLASSDMVAVHCSLEGLAALGRYQLDAVCSGARGLAGQAAGDRSVVSHFQELLLRRLLLEDTPQDLVELAAVALLPLLLSEPAAFAPLSASLAAAAGAQGEARAAQAVEAALAQLGGSLQAHATKLGGGDTPCSGLELRNATRQFRQQLSQLVSDVRGFVRRL